MKTLLIIIGLFFTIHSFAQVATVKDVETNNKGVYGGYITKTGELFNVGDTLIIGNPSQELGFRYITVWNGLSEVKMSSKSTISKAVIKKITIERKQLCIYTFKPLDENNPFGLIVYKIEDAIQSGEIKSKFPTSDEALTQLKKEKEKLDLGLITPEQYEQKKLELMKFIK